MIILGVDPGTLITGYGIIEARGSSVRLLAADTIKNDSDTSLPLRLRKIHERLTDAIKRYKPDEFAIETAFYGKNVQSALKLGHARGVAILAAVTRQIPVQEYSPREVKKAIVGNGNATKDQVKYMVMNLLNLKTAPKYYDTTDALAVAICHLHRTGTHGRSHRSWKSFVSEHPGRVVSNTGKPS